MTNHPNFTLYFKCGIVGLADEAHETFEIVFDPALSDEQNQMVLAGRAAAFQAKLSSAFSELMIVKFPVFLKQKAEAEGWEIPEGLLP